MALTEQEEFELLSLEREKTMESGQNIQPPQTEQPQQPSIQPQNILGQLFNVPGAAIRSAIQGRGYAQGAMQPDAVPKFQNMALDKYYSGTPDFPGKTAVGNVVSAGGMAADMATDPSTLLSMLLGGIGSKTNVAKNIAKTEVTLKNDKLAGDVINSLIKPTHKEFMFGKNPGQAIAKEGLTATNLESLGAKVEGRIEGIKQAISTIRSTPENIYKSVNLSDIRKPLVSSLAKLKQTPRTNAQEISGIDDAISDITDLIKNTDKIGLGKLPVSDAYKIKDAVSKMQKWNRDTSVGTELNKALKQVYHSIDEKIDVAIPELKELNSRMSNLISAKQAIGHRVEVLQRQEPANWSGVLNLPFAAYRSTIAKTTLGKLLARSYKSIK